MTEVRSRKHGTVVNNTSVLTLTSRICSESREHHEPTTDGSLSKDDRELLTEGAHHSSPEVSKPNDNMPHDRLGGAGPITAQNECPDWKAP